jgi:hypothetical protein
MGHVEILGLKTDPTLLGIIALVADIVPEQFVRQQRVLPSRVY